MPTTPSPTPPTTPYPTIYEFPNSECSLFYSDSKDWTINQSTTASFLDEDDGLLWINIYEKDSNINITQNKRWLFTVLTEFELQSSYDQIVLTTDIYGDFNPDPNFLISHINPKFFISDDSSNYIGISFGIKYLIILSVFILYVSQIVDTNK